MRDPSGEAFVAALEWVAASLTARGLSDQLRESTERIGELVTRMKRYTYMDRGAIQEVDVHQGIDDTIAILRYKLRQSSVEVIRDYDPAVQPILASGSELNQVWTNLLDNAIDSVDGSGTIRVRTKALADGISVEVEDDGPGIPAETESRIFEPFFTTKEAGRGTGLGLDIVRRIVRAHGGDISLESRPGETRFRVKLPAAA